MFGSMFRGNCPRLHVEESSGTDPDDDVVDDDVTSFSALDVVEIKVRC